MSNELQLKDITEKITAIQDTNSQILRELTELATSFRYMKEKIDNHAAEMESIQIRVRANEMAIGSINQSLARMDRNTDRVINPIIRYGVTTIMGGLIAMAIFMIKGS